MQCTALHCSVIKKLNATQHFFLYLLHIILLVYIVVLVYFFFVLVVLICILKRRRKGDTPCLTLALYHAQLAMRSLYPEHFSTSEVVLHTYLWTYSKCCQVSSVQVKHSVFFCFKRSNQNMLCFIQDHTIT